MSPPSSAVVGGGPDDRYRFTVLADGIVRMEWAPDGVFEDRPSAFAAHRHRVQSPQFTTRDSGSKLEIITSRFHLTYNKHAFAAYGLYALVFGFTRSLWRYKELGQPNLGGTYRTLDNVDGKLDREHNEDIVIEPGILSPKGYALLDDSHSMLFTEDGFVAPRRPGDDRIDCYLFAYGRDYRAALKAYYAISGPTPLIPRWALGNWWSRYYSYTQDSYLELMDQFAKYKIPLSVAVLDMDWHLVDDKRVVDAGQTGWTGYTWNRDFFPDPPAFLAELHRRKLRVTLNEHPADGIHSYEDVYPEVAKFMGVDPTTKQPIEFDCVDRKYMQAYFDLILRPLERDGCDFWWIDWQQGPYSNLPGVDPLWVLNHFHYEHQRRVVSKTNPLIFSRYAGPGSHRYPIGFSGDTYTTWASLDFQPEFTATASNIGYGWWSHDIGGHMLGIKDDELMVRWIQFGVFSPIMRLHSTKNRWVAKEPWRLPGTTRDEVANLLRIRHQLVPYLQTMNYRAAVEGEPLIQPMYWEYPDVDEAYQFKNQYLFGSEILVAPITQPGDQGLRIGKVRAWVPPGRYFDWFTGDVYEGGRIMWLSRPLSQVPVFLRAGAIVPLASPEDDDFSFGTDKPDTMWLDIAPGKDGQFDIREEPKNDHDNCSDDPTHWSATTITYEEATGTVTVHPVSNTMDKISRKWVVTFLGISTPKIAQPKVLVDGRPSESWHVKSTSRGYSVHINESVPSSATVQISLDGVPTIRASRARKVIEEVLQTAQIEYDIKDKVWAVLEASGDDEAAALGQLLALKLDENMRVWLIEILGRAGKTRGEA